MGSLWERKGKGKRERKRKREGKRERKGREGTTEIHTVSGKMARWRNTIQHANKLFTVHGLSKAQFLTGQMYCCLVGCSQGS